MPFLIFLSLGVIIYIVGKHLPEFKKSSQALENEKGMTEDKAIKRFKRMFFSSWAIFKNGLFCFLEIIIKKIKQFLHLIHFWILKTKKGDNGKNEEDREIEIKQELIEAEEESLEKIIEDDFTDNVSVEIKKDFSSSTSVKLIDENDAVIEKFEEQESVVFEKEFEKETEPATDEKIESFFSEESKKISGLGGAKKFSLVAVLSMFEKFRNKFGKNKQKELMPEEDDERDQNDLFSDGIIDVREVDHGDNVDENSLIKEVVPVRRKEPVDIDDEIGIDRSILEKKLIQKIANNPKDMENYRELGELYIKTKSFSDAEECYKQILRVHLRDVDAKRKMEKIKLLKRMG